MKKYNSLLNLFRFLLIILTTLVRLGSGGPEENEGVKYANKCEVCKIVSHELQARLEETGKVQEVLEIGYSLDDVKPKKKTQYKKSELRLVESLENICDKILEYNIHKEREDSTRFARGMSQTFKTLHGLVDKGVKVDLGIPLELWDKPSVEITKMKTQCELLLEDYESEIEDWYWKHQEEENLQSYLCTQRYLKNSDQSCLTEGVELKAKGEQGNRQERNAGEQKRTERKREGSDEL
ncbi:protein canopy 4-like [Homalodisca vitripennis]|uniref:protein canopy 4-like n=1 Tax=Homalodisca vitripennis TaxID=197043 RepID=UPI001EEBA9D2|nr:protein canopy 4-like [Homalodisca vitripennis]